MKRRSGVAPESRVYGRRTMTGARIALALLALLLAAMFVASLTSYARGFR